MDTALITGINGQDGSYLADFLLDKGYKVIGMIRRSSVDTHDYRIKHLISHPNFKLVCGDVTDAHSVLNIIDKYLPEEIYNLAAQSHVHVSFDQPSYTMDVNYKGLLNILEAVRFIDLPRGMKIYQAGTSEMFGSTPPPQCESSLFHPRSPYAVAKVAAFHLAQNYREAYGMQIWNGILFNHESPRRGREFVTQKIVQQGIECKQGKREKVLLGNLAAKRDWGHAKDYVKAMWLMLQKSKPDDFVVSTGNQYSVQDFVNEVQKNIGNFKIEVSSDFYRPSEVESLCGDCSKLKSITGWEPVYTFEELVHEMITSIRYPGMNL
jgi:GDPmannose 4,6-dehydratase